MNTCEINQNKEVSSAIISLLRFPLTLLVVCIHTFGSPLWSNIAVPCFFIISGYLFFFKIDNYSFSDYKVQMKKRIRSLFVPHILWCSLYLLFYCLIHSEDIITYLSDNGWFHIYYDSDKVTDIDSLFGWSSTEYYPILGVAWYLRDLILCALISPMIFWLLKKMNFVYLSFLIIVYVFRVVELPLHGLTIGSLLFFSLGASLGISKNKISAWGIKRIFPLGILAIISIITAYIAKDGIVMRISRNVYILTCTIAVFGVAEYLFNKYQQRLALPPFIVRSSFIIFITHQFYLPLIKYPLIGLCSSPFTKGIAFIVTYLLTILVGIIIYVFLNKLSPAILRYMQGGR